MELVERFIKYCQIDTQSDPNSHLTPSTSKQYNLANLLVNELKELGIDDAYVDEYCVVYGHLKSNCGSTVKMGFNAHMDTSDAMSGKDVKPRIIENYDGEDIVLNKDVTTDVKSYPFLKDMKGKTLVVTDGTTLLGADDKAGIAIIMEVLETLVKNPNIKHCPIRVCFTTDEETGDGIANFNYDLFKVDFAYTLDGSDCNCICYENFNGDDAIVKLHGVSIHPGTAKDRLINAIKLASEFNDMLDPLCAPEHSDGRQGFNHPVEISGTCEEAKLSYIVRNFDIDELHKQEEELLKAQDKMNAKYGYKACEVSIVEGYKNMKDSFKDNTYSIDLVKKAMNELNMNYKEEAIRGGTDGARLSCNGLLCPDLGTGGRNYHGVHELWCLDEAKEVLNLVLKIVSIVD